MAVQELIEFQLARLKYNEYNFFVAAQKSLVKEEFEL